MLSVSSRHVVWALGALVVVAYVSVLAGGQTFADLGWLGEITPARQAAGDAVAAGHVPGWWHEAGFGVPLIAEPDHAALYPPTWLAALGGHALDVVALAHLWLLAIGTAALAGRLGADTAGRLLAGAASALSAIAAGALVGGTLFAVAWAPLAATLAFGLADAITRRAHGARLRRAVALAACLAACKLAGTPIVADAAILTVLAIGIVGAGGRGAIWCFAAAVGSLALAGVQLAPSLVMAVTDGIAGTTWRLPGVGLVELIAPGATGGVGARFGGGAAVVVLALLTRARWLVVPAALLLAAMVRPPIALMAWTWLAALAGVGFGVLTREPPARAVVVRAAVVLGGLVTALVAVAAARYPIAAAIDRAGVDGAAAVHQAQLRGLLALAFAGATVVLALFAARRREAHLAAMAALLALVEVALAGRAAVPRRPRNADDGAIVAALAKVAPTRVFRNTAGTTPEGRDRDRDQNGDRNRSRSRAVSLDDALAHAALASAAPLGIAALPGHDPARQLVEDVLRGATSSAVSRLIDRYAIPYAIVPATVVTPAGVTLIARHGDEALVATAPRRSPAFWVSRWRHNDDAFVHEALTPPPGGTTEPLGTVVLSGRGDAGGDELALPRGCALRRPHAGEVHLDCEVTARGYAVVLDAWAPGWTVTVDGRAATVERAELIARAVRVEPGARRIVFRYTTPGLHAGAAISALALVNALLLLWLSRRARA